jgi:predicted ester cyclase
MSGNANKEVVRRYNEALWSGDEGTARAFLAPDCVIHGIGGPDEIVDVFRTFREGIPDLSGTVDEQIAEGDKVVTRWTMQGTHSGDVPVPFGPLRGTGKPFTYTGITINRVADGKIVEDRFEADYFGLVQQLGGLLQPVRSEGTS